MFDPEQAITHWRQQLLAAGIQSSGSLDELEGHLREEINRQMEFGKVAAEAFEISARQIGRPEILINEFHKNEEASSRRIGTLAIVAGAVIILRILVRYGEMGTPWKSEQLEWLLAGVAAVLYGLGSIFLNIGLGETKEIRFWKLVGITYSLFAVWISLLPVCSFLTAPKSSVVFTMADRAVAFTAIALCALSVSGWRFGCRMLPVIRNRHTRTAIGIACCLTGPGSLAMFFYFFMPQANRFPLVEFFLAWIYMAVLGGVGYGLAEAARRKTTTIVVR